MSFDITRATTEWQVRDYADIAAYRADLAVQAAAGWYPISVTNLLTAPAVERLVATYGREVA